MKTAIYRVWRGVIVTLFLLTVACSGRDVSGNPQAVDALTVEYIMHDLAADIESTDKNVLSVERVKLTRQDAIPIALVDVVYKDGTTGREFYGFDYQQIVSVCELLDTIFFCILNHRNVINSTSLGSDKLSRRRSIKHARVAHSVTQIQQVNRLSRFNCQNT